MNGTLLGFFARVVVAALLYALAGFLAILSIGSSISTPGDEVQRTELMLMALWFRTGAGIAAWVAGLLWIGRVIDFFARRRASPLVFLTLAVVAAIPQMLLYVLDETRTLSDLRVISWILTPPALIIALLRFVGLLTASNGGARLQNGLSNK